MSFILDEIKDLTLKETTVKVRLNEKEIVEVNKFKLLESSLYFKNILSSKFKDHKREFVEIKYQVNIETFKTVMSFVGTGQLCLGDENFLEVLGFAVYLQMEKLQKFCLDHFTSKLSRSNVEAKYDMLKKSFLPVDEFKQSALSFITNNTCGLYFIQKEPIEPIRSSLNFFSFENKTFRNISCYRHNRSVDLNLHHFNKTLVICPRKKLFLPGEPIKSCDNTRLCNTVIIYDLITEETKELPLDFDVASTNCSNENQLFVVSVVELDEKSEKNYFSLETFDSAKEFSSAKKTVDYDLVEGYQFAQFHYAEWVDDKVFLFYQAKLLEKNSNEYNFRSNVKDRRNYMMIVCAKTLKIDKNINIADDDAHHEEKIIKGSDPWKELKDAEMYESLSLKKENKLFIQFDYDAYCALVFDIEKQIFYFIEEKDRLKIQPEDIDQRIDRNVNIFRRGEEYFGLVSTGWLDFDDECYDEDDKMFDQLSYLKELRSYEVENNALVEKEVVWSERKNFALCRNFRWWKEVFSTAVVQSVCLD